MLICDGIWPQNPLAAFTSDIMLNSSVEEQGSRVSCPGEKVTFTCTVLRGNTLQWISDAFSSAPRTFSLFHIDSTREPRTYGEFTARLTESVPDPGEPGFGDLTSSLIFTATPELNGTVIQCSNQLTIMSKTTIVPGTVHILSFILNSRHRRAYIWNFIVCPTQKW